MSGDELPECIAKKWEQWMRTGNRALLRDIGEILWIETNWVPENGYPRMTLTDVPAKVLLVLKLERII